MKFYSVLLTGSELPSSRKLDFSELIEVGKPGMVARGEGRQATENSSRGLLDLLGR